MRRTSLLVLSVIIAASALGFALFRASPSVNPSSVVAVLLLSLLALVAELLGFLLPRSATGSIAFIPYLAAVVVVPSWPTMVAVLCVRLTVEVFARRSSIKVVFNSFQHALTVGIAICVFRAAGGYSLLTIAGAPLARATLLVGAPAIAAFASALAANHLLVCTAIALSTGTPVLRVWKDVLLSSIGFDLAAAPLIFTFAWVYASFGPIAAATLWVPILGLRQVYTANLDLEKMNQELLQLMVKSIEARDPYTSGHSRRVQHHSTVIARVLGLTERQIARVSRAALLHDVGKIYEKYAPILRKEDKLSTEEWATMQEHPADGAGLVATMSGLKDIVAAVRHHHERWDGSGYPDGLAGEAIPLESRIICFADTIDAMTSERPYRRPLSEHEVREEIIRCRGQQFDPSIADRLLSSSAWKTLFESPSRLTPRFGLTLVQEKIIAQSSRAG